MGLLSCNKRKYNSLIRVFLSVLFLALFSFAQNLRTPQSFGAQFVKYNDIKKLQKDAYNTLSKSAETKSSDDVKSDKTGFTFKAVPFDEELDINTFTKKTANDHLERDLFESPEYTATYYYSSYDKKSVVTENTYVQFVSDASWNRILYGNLQGELKSYSDILKPGEIVVNSAGYVFIAERGKSRIQVLKLEGKNKDVNLHFIYAIENTGEISSLAYNDGGTPFDLNDDFLLAANESASLISKYNITESSAIKETEYKGFKWPTAITFGRWDGANSDDLYVIDSYARKVTLYQLDGENLTKISELKAKDIQNFSAIETDHFGQVYIADRANSEIFKYTSDLNFLDSQKLPYKGAHDINIPFGTVNIDGQKHWVGFDQAFMIQNWNDDSGVIRYKLGVALNDLTYSLSDNNEEILMTYNSTEFANRQFTISDREGTVYTSDATTGPSGENQMTWNRINSKNEQVAPGNYTINIELQSLYDESIITRESSFYLPLFYHVNCGDEDNTPAIKKISGTPASYNGRSVVESTDRIIYKISGLNPSSEYKVAAEFLKLDNESVQQQIFVDGLMLDQPFEINTADYKTDFIKLPVEALSDGMIQIEVQRVGSGNANLADLWIMETGKEFSILNAQKSLPTAYQLSQNYPNPFNPATTINYQLPGNSRVTLKVYDITGREIRTLVNNYQEAGEHQVIFDGNSLASGIYIYNLSWVAENGSKGFQSRKMVLIK